MTSTETTTAARPTSYEVLALTLTALSYDENSLSQKTGITVKRAKRILSGNATVFIREFMDICNGVGIDGMAIMRAAQSMQHGTGSAL